MENNEHELEPQEEIPEQKVNIKAKISRKKKVSEPVEVESESDSVKNNKYTSFIGRQRGEIVDGVRQVIKDELWSWYKEKADYKKKQKEEEERQRREKEDAELFEAFKKFKATGLTHPLAGETKPKKNVSNAKETCEFCKKDFLARSYVKHVESCPDNPNGKHADKFKHRFQKKPNKIVEQEPEEEIEEPEVQRKVKEVKAKAPRKAEQKYQSYNEDIW